MGEGKKMRLACQLDLQFAWDVYGKEKLWWQHAIREEFLENASHYKRCEHSNQCRPPQKRTVSAHCSLCPWYFLSKPNSYM